MYKYNHKTAIISYHSIHDNLAPATDKINYLTDLKEQGHRIDFTLVQKESDIDGKFIKNLNHSMGMSNKELLKWTMPKISNIVKNSSPTDLEYNSTICYQTSLNQTYTFSFANNKLVCTLI